ncbi:TetR/AcrR family transcriptional regulator [Dechloromonas denitrificans]|uniref:acrylate utilization transcriptional regulator AcuR n=1 Tax=Dechloromonas denitrificans TaxID=281362 RepID=UPI001CF86F57|nr:TetR family transcriptional regulator C-terminal domain-containing protein [Dechloromonas denitrificans]UCV12683.1 TetR/AcrR family transcriptional regulator [Dechloromonas denitrificans]
MPSSPPLPRRPRGRPARNGIGFADTRTLLIRRAIEMLTERGVSATALDDILKSAQVPKGSFYHYFASKDEFVAAALDAYADYFADKLDRHFLDVTRSPLARLAAFVDDACHGVARHDFCRGCLVGNLGQEVSTLDDKLRRRLEAIFNDWEQRLGTCLSAAVDAGELAAGSDCPALAHAFWVGWEGAILRARLLRSTAPMQAFFKLFQAALPRP